MVSPDELLPAPLPFTAVAVAGRVVTVRETGAEKSAGDDGAAIRVAVMAGESWLVGTMEMWGVDEVEGRAWYCC